MVDKITSSQLRSPYVNTQFTAADIPNQTGKTFFITGANTGIGFEAAKAISAKGGRVLLGCRNKEKAAEAQAAILRAQPKADIGTVELDLGSLASVDQAAQVVLQEPRLDVLINNAGIMWTPKSLTEDGFEAQFGVNHLGHFALTGHLLPKLLATTGSRIVNISSVGHRLGNGDLFWNDINAEKEYNPRTRYFASKLANLLFTYELDRRLRAHGASTIAVAAHPGGATTELDRHVYGATRILLILLRPLVLLLANTSETGAWPTELAATGEAVEGGQYFGPSRWNETSGPAQLVNSSPESKDPDKALRLWNLSMEMTGVDPKI